MGRSKKPVQMSLDLGRRPDGKSRRGRPRGRTRVAHERRERFPARYPHHVTLRLVPGISVRKDWLLPVIHGAIRDSQKLGFRVIEFNILGNHLHLIAEAHRAETLSSGMNGLEVRLARRLNKRLKRTGKLFAERYHARALRSPREVRNAIAYVLLNARHHAADRGERIAKGWYDPFSSAPWFAGWSRPLRSPHAFHEQVRARPRPTEDARTWLLTVGWKQRHGPLDVDAIPGGPRPAL